VTADENGGVSSLAGRGCNDAQASSDVLLKNMAEMGWRQEDAEGMTRGCR